MHQLSSFGVRLVLTVLTAATISITALVVLSVFRVEHGLDRQIEELERLSETKVNRRLNSITALAEARLELVFEEAQRQISNIARSRDIARAVESRNHVAMFELLGPATERADLDGILVVDANMVPIGADSDTVDLLAANEALKVSSIKPTIRNVFDENSRSAPRRLTKIMSLAQQHASAIGASEAVAMAAVLIEPIFDDFGDVVAVLIGRRALRRHEESLARVAGIEDVGFVIFAGDEPISTAGTADLESISMVPTDSELFLTGNGENWARCSLLFKRYSICALVAPAELTSLRDEMAQIGQAEGRSLALWLVLAAIGALALCGVSTFYLANRLTRPMARITEAVRQVADGDWKTEVVGIERRDEIGEIARAVVTLQHSLQERDQLRTTAATAKDTDQREEVLRSAIHEFDHGMRSLLLAAVSNLELIDDTSKDLARHWGLAESEADEALFIFERLSTRIGAIEETANALRDSLGSIRSAAVELRSPSGPRVASVGGDPSGISSVAERLDASVDCIESLVRSSSLLSVQARHSSSGNSSADDGVQELAEAAASLSQGITEVVAVLRTDLDALSGIARTSPVPGSKPGLDAASLGAIAQTLDHGIAQHATRIEDLSSHLEATSNGYRNIANSVQRLKQTVFSARGSSLHVETAVTQMTNEAQAFDKQMKELLQTVAG